MSKPNLNPGQKIRFNGPADKLDHNFYLFGDRTLATVVFQYKTGSLVKILVNDFNYYMIHRSQVCSVIKPKEDRYVIMQTDRRLATGPFAKGFTQDHKKEMSLPIGNCWYKLVKVK